ncbi:hypothetical protein C7212DRAFT_360747 [Tuber magnatum]|nr:hypothetical protein C7212DRAFT_360747 [Tuber magnatum]
MPMGRSPDRMDLDVGRGDRRETAWWERLTKDSVRMQKLAGKLNPACFPIDAGKTCPEVDAVLEEVYLTIHPPSHTQGTHMPELSFSTARTHTISAINDLLHQGHSKAASKGEMGAFSMSHFLGESYPKSAPFNAEALHSRAGDRTRDGDSVAFPHRSSGGLRGGTSFFCKGPRNCDRFHPRDSHPHPHPRYGRPATHTLKDPTGHSPGGSGASGISPSEGRADGATISSSPPTTHNPSRRRTHTHPRSLLNRGHPHIRNAHRFDVPRSRTLNGTGPRGQHKCDECEKAFPYPSKLK